VNAQLVSEAPKPDTSVLVVDLDGTLTPTDTLLELIVKIARRSPRRLLHLALWILSGRGRFKEAVSTQARIAADRLPYRQAFVDYLRDERAKGRRIVLATAAHHAVADAVAAHLGLFDAVIASREGGNLKGAAKLAAIQSEIGSDFVYAADSRADLPIWRGAKAAVLVSVSARTASEVRRAVPIEREFVRRRTTLADWVRALRVYQWSKNALLFVPALAAFSLFEPGKLASLVLAFLSFSLAASASYVLNDLLDLESDRNHARKSLRPFASGQISILSGVLAAGVALVLSLALASAVSLNFLLMLVLYLAATATYSWVLKEYVLVDVLVLALLFTLRILAGAVAANVDVSSWLLAFSVFLFLSLALVKRCAELKYLELNSVPATAGRDYRVSDLAVLWPLGVGAALSAVVVFGLFISASETQERYALPNALWFAAVGMIYWLGRLWIKTSRGEMHDDPIVFAVRDRGSRITILVIVVIVLGARFVSPGDLP